MMLCQNCYYDQEGVLYPDSGNCTPDASPSFNADIIPWLELKCNNCHGGSNPSANISLTTYSEVLTYVNNGKLLGSIKHETGYSPMPKNATRVSDCEIQTLQNWINGGALNN